MISLASSHCRRTKPPMPRRVLYERAFSLSSTMLAQASTGALLLRASRHRRSSVPRISGYFSRLALYRYQE